MEAFWSALLCSYGDLTRISRSVCMSTRNSKLFQPLPITSSKAASMFLGMLCSSTPHFLVPIPVLVNRGCFNQVPESSQMAVQQQDREGAASRVPWSQRCTRGWRGCSADTPFALQSCREVGSRRSLSVGCVLALFRLVTELWSSGGSSGAQRLLAMAAVKICPYPRSGPRSYPF